MGWNSRGFRIQKEYTISLKRIFEGVNFKFRELLNNFTVSRSIEILVVSRTASLCVRERGKVRRDSEDTANFSKVSLKLFKPADKVDGDRPIDRVHLRHVTNDRSGLVDWNYTGQEFAEGVTGQTTL